MRKMVKLQRIQQHLQQCQLVRSWFVHTTTRWALCNSKGREPDEDDLDIDHDDAPLRLHAMDEVLGAATLMGYAARELSRGGDDCLFIVSTEEPGSVGQAIQEVVWRKAMEEELWAIEDNLLGLNSRRLSALNTRTKVGIRGVKQVQRQ
jgi:hypothetical protein